MKTTIQQFSGMKGYSSVVILVILLLASSCSQDDDILKPNGGAQNIEALTNEDIPKITGARTSMSDILDNPVLSLPINDLLLRQDYGADDIVTNSNTGGTYTGIVLDTSYIKKYITDKYENYTFKIIQGQYRRTNIATQLPAHGTE